MPPTAYTPPVAISDDNPEDLRRLRRCVELAREALDAGDEPFGSVLVSADGEPLFEDRNRVTDGPHGGDATRHPEFAIARWAAANLAPPGPQSRNGVHLRRALSDVLGGARWVGLGRIVYAASSSQLAAWRAAWGAARRGRAAALPVAAVAPAVTVDGPAPDLADELKALHEANFRR